MEPKCVHRQIIQRLKKKIKRERTSLQLSQSQLLSTHSPDHLYRWSKSLTRTHLKLRKLKSNRQKWLIIYWAELTVSLDEWSCSFAMQLSMYEVVGEPLHISLGQDPKSGKKLSAVAFWLHYLYKKRLVRCAKETKRQI